MLDGLPEQRYLKISIQEPEQQGINRWVQVELASHGENVIRVQSISESWAIGKAESLLTYLRPFQRGLVTQFRKFGLSLNVLITMVTLAALPGLSGFWPRLAFAFSILGLQTVFAYLHGKIVPNFLLYSALSKPSRLKRAMPAITSWVLAIGGAVIGSVIYGALKGELNDSPLLNAIHNIVGSQKAEVTS